MNEPRDQPLRYLGAILRGELPPGDVAWEDVLALARQYDVLPLFSWWLMEQQAVVEGTRAAMPEPVTRALRFQRHTAAAVLGLREHELVRVLTALDRAEVPVVLLKGVALAYTVYPEPALRTMRDMDFLIRREHLDRASQVLTSLGYEHRPEPPKRLNPFNTEFTGETQFRRAPLAIDLHWELFANELFGQTTALDMEALWERVIPFQIGPVTALSLAPEDALAHVCVHISLHGFAYRRGYVDTTQLVDAGQVDWDVFVDGVRRSRISVACYFPLWRVQQMWGVPVPEEVLRALRPDAVRQRLGAWIMMARQSPTRPMIGGHAWEHVVWLFIIDHLRDLIRLMLWLFFPGPAWLRERYRLRSAWQAWIWVALHPLIVWWEGLRSLITVLVPSSGDESVVVEDSCPGFPEEEGELTV